MANAANRRLRDYRFFAGAYIINNGHIAHEGPTSEIAARPEVLQRYRGV